MIFNGQQIKLKKEISVSKFLRKEKFCTSRIAIEKNGVIVPKKLFNTEMLSDSDIIEIVHFVGGG